MSIIEKAIDKLGRKTPAPEQAPISDEEQVRKAVVEAQRLEEAGQLGDAGAPATDGGIGQRTLNLPFMEMKQKGMVTPDTPRGRAAEEFRRIKRPLLMNIDGEGAAVIQRPNLIMVTSALPGEGKTFTAINLAMSIAMEQDKTVLFVDADVSKATAARILGVPNDSKGLIDVLEDASLNLRDVMYRTNLPNLRVLAAGRVHERSTELLASESMRRLMDELSRRYPDRVIVFDAPPLLPTTEAGVLANLMGQIVFVVAAGETSQGAVTEALTHIDGDKMIGLVLNKSTARFGASYGYGYGYDFGYGYGYGQDGQRVSQQDG